MRNKLLQQAPKIIIFLLVAPSLSCQEKREVRGVNIACGQTASPSFNDLELKVSVGEQQTLRYVVSGNRLKWSFDDLNNDGKSDLTITSSLDKTYFAKFLIQDHEPRIQLLHNQGITVTKMPSAGSN